MAEKWEYGLIIMKRLLHVCAILLALGCLAGCGPKNIGEGYSDQGYRSSGSGVMPEDQLRFPMIGMSQIQHTLYHLNRPQYMASVQATQARIIREAYASSAAAKEDDSQEAFGFSTWKESRRLSPFRQ